MAASVYVSSYRPRSRTASRLPREHTGYGGVGPPESRLPVPCREPLTGTVYRPPICLPDYLTHTLPPFNRRGSTRRYTPLVWYGRHPIRSLRCRARADALRERRSIWADARTATIPAWTVRTLRGARFGRVPAGCGPRRAEFECHRRGTGRSRSTGPRRPPTLLGSRDRNGALRTPPSPVARSGRRPRAAGLAYENRPGEPGKPGGSRKDQGCRRRGIFRRVPYHLSAIRGRPRRLDRDPGRRPCLPVPTGSDARLFEEGCSIEGQREWG